MAPPPPEPRDVVQPILLQLTIYLASALLFVPLSQWLGFGSVLGYLVAGMAIGPALGLVGNETVHVQEYAEYGIVLMLFLIGLEMHPRMLWDLRHRLVGLGGLQIILTVGVVAAAAMALGLQWNAAVASGIILSLSSTAIVMQMLAEKRLLRTEGGRASLAVLLFQDVAAIPLLALLPLLALGGAAPVDEHEMLKGLSPSIQAAVIVGAVVFVILGGRFLTRPAYRFLSLAHLPEVQVGGALFLIVFVSLIMSEIGMSPALGSFLAGVMLARSEFRHQLEADLAPFKGILLGLFFITVGAGMDLGRLAEAPLRLIGLTLGVMLLKMLVLWPLAWLFRLPAQARLLFTFGLAQAGEFGFFLLGFAVEMRVLGTAEGNTLLLVIALSMTFTPAFLWIQTSLARRLGSRGRQEAEVIDTTGPVIIVGMGRFGQTVNRILAGIGQPTVVIDREMQTVQRLRRLGVRAFIGDVSRPELLAAAGIREVKALVIAVDDPDQTVRLVEHVSRAYPQVRIIARARDRHHAYRLQAAGRVEIVRELFEGAVTAGRQTLLALGHPAREVEAITAEFVRQDAQMMTELAALWRPGVPPEENPAYLAKEREQAAAIEAALRGRRQEMAATGPQAPSGLAAVVEDRRADGPATGINPGLGRRS